MRQRNGRDCGVAAVAILARVGYDEAAVAHPDARPDDGLQAMEVARMLRRLTGRIIHLRGDHEDQPLAFLRTLPRPAIVLIHEDGDVRGHYVVLENGVVYDPERERPIPLERYPHRRWRVFRVIWIEE